MPYVITITTAGRVTMDGVSRLVPVSGMSDAEREAHSTRRDVDTLDEARARVSSEIWRRCKPLDYPFTLTESGGTIGPLPDGTIIKVTPK